MIPTETEGPAKLAWHKSTRIKKKELQSDFTQDFGLDLTRSLFSGQRSLAGADDLFRQPEPKKQPSASIKALGELHFVQSDQSTFTIQPSGASMSPNWMPVSSSYNLRVTGPTSVSE